MNVKAALLTKAGGRKVNEDYCGIKEKDGFYSFVLADGLGGHQSGDLASRTVGEAVLEAFTISPGLSANYMRNYIDHARSVFMSVGQQTPAAVRMKTTLVVLLTDGKQALWGHIGDSRLYYYRTSKIKLVTKDHSVPQLLADSGEISQEQIRYHEDRNRLTAAFDGSDKMRFVIAEHVVDLLQGDAFLLCSDGFWEHVYDNEMEYDLNRITGPEQWLFEMEQRLLTRVKSGYDNYSVIAVNIF